MFLLLLLLSYLFFTARTGCPLNIADLKIRLKKLRSMDRSKLHALLQEPLTAFSTFTVMVIVIYRGTFDFLGASKGDFNAGWITQMPGPTAALGAGNTISIGNSLNEPNFKERRRT
jgi:hypothetical protein